MPDEPYMYFNVINNTIEIEIKQNKENMEEKKQKLDKLVKDYSYNRIPYEVFDNCLKQLYVDKQIDENNPSLKEFDLEAAKAGKPICTRDGRKARIICFDLNTCGPYSVIAAITNNSDYEEITSYTEDGYYLRQNEESSHDLMMFPEKKEGWVNVYNSLGVITFSHNPFDTKEEAINDAVEGRNKEYYVDTIKITWEE